MRILLLIFLPFLLFAEIVKFENLKPYYYENQIVNLKAKIILPAPKEIYVMPSNNVEANLTQKNPYLYNLNIKFKADKNEHNVILIGDKFYKVIDFKKIIKIKSLTPPKNFSHVLAENLTIINPISSKYDKKHNIVSFTIKCNECNINDFNLTYTEQNLTIISKNKASYYTIVPKNLKNLTFYYFNLKKETFEKINIPIKLKEEIISTQTQLNPEENKIFTPVNILILIFIAFTLIVFLIFQKIWLLIFPLLLSGYLGYKLLPKGEVVLKRNAKIQILPTKQSTIIYVSKGNEKAKVLNKLKNYTKIKINSKIGWVKNEDIK
jgi:hypothetical protein